MYHILHTRILYVTNIHTNNALYIVLSRENIPLIFIKSLTVMKNMFNHILWYVGKCMFIKCKQKTQISSFIQHNTYIRQRGLYSKVHRCKAISTSST